MSENVDNEECIPEGITGDFSLNKLLAKEAEKIKKRQGITGDHSLGELLDMENEKDGFALTEQKTTNENLGHILLKNNLLTEDNLVKVYSLQLGYKHIFEEDILYKY